MANVGIDQPHEREDERGLPSEQGEEPEQREERAPLGHPTAKPRSASPVRLDNDRDLSRIGAWALGLGGLGFLCAIVFLMIGGILPGALVIAVSLLCALIGILAWSLVAHHQG